MHSFVDSVIHCGCLNHFLWHLVSRSFFVDRSRAREPIEFQNKSHVVTRDDLVVSLRLDDPLAGRWSKLYIVRTPQVPTLVLCRFFNPFGMVVSVKAARSVSVSVSEAPEASFGSRAYFTRPCGRTGIPSSSYSSSFGCGEGTWRRKDRGPQRL